jgi:hypothetical protein
METGGKEVLMIPEHTQGAPLAAFFIVLFAILFMGGIAWSFQGSIHF